MVCLQRLLVISEARSSGYSDDILAEVSDWGCVCKLAERADVYSMWLLLPVRLRNTT